MLVTGFEPFAGAVVNPSELLVQALATPAASMPLETLVRAGRILLATTLAQ